jgi:general secretion pathway protein I
MEASKNSDFIPTDGTTSHSTKSPKNGYQVAGYAALREKISCLHINYVRRCKMKFQCRVTFRLAGTKIFPAPCIWANSEFLDTPMRQERQSIRHPSRYSAGFTLLEVLVALVIVGTALGASLRAVGSLTQNSSDLRASMMATWSAENRLSQIRLANEWPALGQRSFDCVQGELHLVCEENVFATPNPFFRRVEVSVFDSQNTERRIIKLAQVVPNAQ